MRKSRYPRIELNHDDLLWLAGLLEGEGCFTVMKVGRRRHPCVRIDMTDEDVIARVSVLWKRKYTRVVPKRASRKDTFVCKVTGYCAVELMKDLLTNMGLRRSSRIRGIIAGLAQ